MPLLVSVSPYVPQRTSPYAGHQWYFHFLAALADHYDVVVLAPATSENRGAVAAGAPTETRLLPGVGHWRTSELQRGPLDKLSDELLRGVVRVDGAGDLLGRAAVIDVQWPRALPHVPALRSRAPAAVLTYLAHDVHWSNWTWSRLAALPVGKRLAGGAIGPLVRARETRLIAGCDAFFAFKAADVDAVHAAGVAIPGAVLGPWLQRPDPAAPTGPPAGDAPTVLFVAAFDRPQNRWGADWLLERVWPLVAREVPEARLVLAGAGAPADLAAAVGAVPGAELTGFVDDLGPWYERATCVVAPVLGGAGLRFKVPQAMLYGRPMVVTPLALEGLETAPPGCFVAVTDEPATFAAGVVASLRGSPAARRSGPLGRAWADAEFSFQRTIGVVLETHRKVRTSRL